MWVIDLEDEEWGSENVRKLYTNRYIWKMWISEAVTALLNNDSFTNKYYNAGIQFLEVTKCVSAILPQRVNLFEIISCLTGFTEASAE